MAPAGLKGDVRGKFRVFVSPHEGKVVAKATHRDVGRNQQFLVLDRGAICGFLGGRGRGAVQDIYYELESDQSADADKDKRSNASLLLFTLPKYN